MDVFWKRIKSFLIQLYYEQFVFPIDQGVFYIKFRILKIHRRSQGFKEQLRKDYDMAGLEWYRIELMKSIAKIPDEFLPQLGDRVYCR